MWFWLGIVWGVSVVISIVWFWYLHTKGELVNDFPYDDEM